LRVVEREARHLQVLARTVALRRLHQRAEQQRPKALGLLDEPFELGEVQPRQVRLDVGGAELARQVRQLGEVSGAARVLPVALQHRHPDPLGVRRAREHGADAGDHAQPEAYERHAAELLKVLRGGELAGEALDVGVGVGVEQLRRLAPVLAPDRVVIAAIEIGEAPGLSDHPDGRRPSAEDRVVGLEHLVVEVHEVVGVHRAQQPVDVGVVEPVEVAGGRPPVPALDGRPPLALEDGAADAMRGSAVDAVRGGFDRLQLVGSQVSHALADVRVAEAVEVARRLVPVRRPLVQVTVELAIEVLCGLEASDSAHRRGREERRHRTVAGLTLEREHGADRRALRRGQRRRPRRIGLLRLLRPSPDGRHGGSICDPRAECQWQTGQLIAHVGAGSGGRIAAD